MKRRLKKKMKKNCASWEKRGKRLTEKIHLSIREQNPQKKIHIYIYIIYISKWNCTVYRIVHERSFDRVMYKILRFIFSMISEGKYIGFDKRRYIKRKHECTKPGFIFSLLILGTRRKIFKKGKKNKKTKEERNCPAFRPQRRCFRELWN